MTLVIMAAGLGSRFGGLKQLEAVDSYGHTLMDFSVYDAKRAGFDRVIIITRWQIEPEMKSMIERKKAKWGVNVKLAFQELDYLPKEFTLPSGREKPWGTAHAVACLDGVIDSPFALINADDYYGYSSFALAHEFLSGSLDEWAMIFYRLKNTLSPSGGVSRGICKTESGYLKEIRETYGIRSENGLILDKNGTELDPDSQTSMNLWCFTPEIIEECKRGFSHFLKTCSKEELQSKEYYLTDVVSNMLKEGRVRIRAIESREKWQGITSREDKVDTRLFLDSKIIGGEYPDI